MFASDCLSEIFTFCKPSERRLLASISRTARETYKNISEDISLGALTKIVRARKNLWKIPPLKKRDTTSKDLMPGIFISRKNQAMRYLEYQCENIRCMSKKKNLDEDTLRRDDFAMRIMTLHYLSLTPVKAAVTIGNLRNFQKTSETYKRNQNQS